MIIYALQIKSFPKIKGAFSYVGKAYDFSTEARKGQLEIAFVSGIRRTIKSDTDEIIIDDGDISIAMPDIGFEGKAIDFTLLRAEHR